MNVCWEAMVDEMRAERLEADNRRHFTAEKQPIELVRTQLREWTDTDAEDPELTALRSAASLRALADDELFDVG